MRRTYIPFHFDKTLHRTIYYDTGKNRFFENTSGQQNPMLGLLSGTTGVVLYSYFSSWTLTFLDSRLTMLLGASVLTLLLSAGLIGLFFYLGEKGRGTRNYVAAPPPEELPGLIRESRRWLLSQIMLMLGFFALNLFFTLFLIILFTSGLLFAGMIGLWSIFIMMLWLLQPFARLSLLRWLEGQSS